MAIHEEWFDIYNDARKLIGQQTRSKVHANGLWHRSIHIWVLLEHHGETYLLVQQRHPSKDTYPGYYDISCAGHLEAGEDDRAAIRELNEELAISTTFDQLIWLFEAQREMMTETQGNSIIDREWSNVYLLRLNEEQSTLILNQSVTNQEVLNVMFAPIQSFLLFIQGESNRCELVERNNLKRGSHTLTMSALVPREKEYYPRLHNAIRKHVEI